MKLISFSMVLIAKRGTHRQSHACWHAGVCLALQWTCQDMSGVTAGAGEGKHLNRDPVLDGWGQHAVPVALLLLLEQLPADEGHHAHLLA